MERFRWGALTVSVLAVAVAVVMLVPLPAGAVVTLTYDDNLKDIQQTDNNPCVIGSPSCGSGSPPIDFTSVPGGPGDQDLDSPLYTVGEITTAVGSDAMNLLIDVNQACGSAEGCPITLDLVEVFVDGTLEFVFNGPQLVPLAGSLQGNGFSDAGLGVIDFSPFADSATVLFHIVWSDQSDGQESFFLAATTVTPPPTVAQPAPLLLVGAGLIFVGLWACKGRVSARG